MKSVLLASMAALLLGSAALAADASAYVVPDDANDVQPLVAGTLAPSFTVRRADGTPYTYDPKTVDAPVILIFYRGGWCPFCNVHLGQLKEAQSTLSKRGYNVMFLSADRPEILRTSLKEETQGEVINYTLLSDSEANASRAFRVAFRVPDETAEQYKGFGVDLDKTAGNSQHILPVPAVYVIDKDGMIQFMHFNPDYKVRLSAEELLAEAP